MEKEDIERLRERLGAVDIYPAVEETIRVRYPDGKFSFWRVDDAGKWYRLGLKYYSPQLNKTLTKYDFLMLSDFSDGVCMLVDSEPIPGTASAHNRGKFEPTLRYAVYKNGTLQTSKRFQNVNAFKHGMGVAENYNNGNGGTYSYVTLDAGGNFLYLPGEYLAAYDFDGEKAEVRTRTGLRKFINRSGQFVEREDSRGSPPRTPGRE